MATNAAVPFIQKLRVIVDSGEAVRWRPDGTTFVVYDVAKFESEVLAKWFKSPHMASFVRQLNFYGFRKLTTRGRTRDSASSKQWEFQHPMFLREDKAAAKQIHRRTTADTEAIRSEGESMRLAVASLRNQLATVKKQLAEANRQLVAADAARRNAEQESADLRRRLKPQATARGQGWVADSGFADHEQATESTEDSLHTILRGVVDRKRRRVGDSTTDIITKSTGTTTSRSSARKHPPISLGIRAPTVSQTQTQAAASSSSYAAWAPVTVAVTPNPARDETVLTLSSCSSSSSSFGPSGLAASFAGLQIASTNHFAGTTAPVVNLDTPMGTAFDDDCESPSVYSNSSRPVLRRMDSAGRPALSRDGISVADSMGGSASALDVASLGLHDSFDGASHTQRGGGAVHDDDSHRFGLLSTSSSTITPMRTDQHLLAVTPLSRVGSDRSILSLASSAGSVGFAPTLAMSSRTELPPASMPGSHSAMSSASSSQPSLVARSSSVDSTGTDIFARDGFGLSALGTFPSTAGFPSLYGPMAPPPSRTTQSASSAAAAAAEADAAASSSSTASGNTDEVVSVARQVARMPRPEFAKTLSQIALAIVCSNQLGAIPTTPSTQPSSTTSSAWQRTSSEAPASPVAPEEAKGAALDVLRRFTPTPILATAAEEGTVKPGDSSAAVVVAASRVMSSPDIKPADSHATKLPEELSHVSAELLLATLMRMKRVQTFVATAATGLISAAAVSAAARRAAATPAPTPALQS